MFASNVYLFIKQFKINFSYYSQFYWKEFIVSDNKEKKIKVRVYVKINLIEAINKIKEIKAISTQTVPG